MPKKHWLHGLEPEAKTRAVQYHMAIERAIYGWPPLTELDAEVRKTDAYLIEVCKDIRELCKSIRNGGSRA